MSILETQVGQIFINNRKLSKSFISLFSEKIAESGVELFILVEAALSSTGTASEYEKILKSAVNTLRRNFKKSSQEGFENAIAQINEDLSGIASQGQIAWVDKLNACIAVRQADSLAVATTGKIHAYLFREGQLSDIADSGRSKQNPLRAFENFAIGKVAKKDYLIFTTNQLFNYIAIERLQKILNDLPIGTACKTIGDLIKELADESISFGTFIVELGYFKDSVAPQIFEEPEQRPKISAETQKVLIKIKNAFKGARGFAAHTMLVGNKAARASKLNTPVKNEVSSLSKLKAIDLKKIKDLPRTKKFFFSAAIIFFLVLIANIAIAARVHYKNKNNSDLNKKLADIQSKINDANAAYIYNDQKTTQDLLNSAKAEFNTLPQDNKTISDQLNKISAELTALENSLGHVQTVSANLLFTYSGSTTFDAIELLNNSLYLINFQGDLFVPYSLSSGKQGQDFTISIPPLSAITNSNGTLFAIDKNGGIYQLDLSNKTATKQKGLSIPESIGLAAYGSPTKLYNINKSGDQIFSTALSDQALPYMALPEKNAIDIAVDGSIYVLYSDKILKFNSKQQKPFDSGMAFSSGSKIYTDKTLNYVYVLDPLKGRLIVLNKTNGSVVNQYGGQLPSLKNFVIDSKNRAIYLISGQSVEVIHF